MSPESLQAQGLMLGTPAGALSDPACGIEGTLLFERPAYPFAHRLKNCTLGAFSYFNAAGRSSAYATRFGRYVQVGESCIFGPPEHVMDGFTTHPFAYTRPLEMPNMYRLPDFAALAPPASDAPSWAATRHAETLIGHEVYFGAGCFVKRGVRIGDGAVIGAGSVVTRDIPPFSIAVGNPARVIRLRFAESLVARLLRLQWWRYDLAPFRAQLDFTQVEATLATLEQWQADGRLHELKPASFCVTRQADGGLDVASLPQALYFS
ncbi:MAG: CatB-related O-acetyltransferase [Pseudomonadota bacterium]